MTDENNGTPYRQNALYVTESTSVDEVMAYLRHCVENPLEVGDKLVWNFSTHEPDTDALEEVKEKNQDKFVVPYQVTGMWGFMFGLIPDDVKDGDILVYHEDDGQYYAYRNFYRTTPVERQQQIREDLARRLESVSSEVLDVHE